MLGRRGCPDACVRACATCFAAAERPFGVITTAPGALFPWKVLQCGAPVLVRGPGRRYVAPAMPVPRSGGRICARPDCARAATSSLTYHYGSSSVWVDDLTDRDPSRYDLCEL